MIILLKQLKERDLKSHLRRMSGLVEAAGEVFPQVAVQRCIVYWHRNAAR
jgi:transposase-like protein